MIDIETLDTKPGGIVLSIGGVRFNRHTGAIDSGFYVEIDPRRCGSMGMTVSVDTLMWWMQQDAQARAVFNGSTQPAQACAEFLTWCRNVDIENCKVWTQGDMDLPMIAALLQRFGHHAPWKFWNYRDTRSAYDALNFDPRTVQRNGTYHNALDDAKHQVACLTTALNQ